MNVVHMATTRVNAQLSKRGPAEAPGWEPRGTSGRGQVANLAPQDISGSGSQEHKREDDGVKEALQEVMATKFSIFHTRVAQS